MSNLKSSWGDYSTAPVCEKCGAKFHPASSKVCMCHTKDKKLDSIKEWNSYFKEIAETVKKKSKDESTNIGAVIVGSDNEIISTGYNSFPRGLDDDRPERQERPEKYNWFEHAERNAIYNAARIGVSVKGATMYLTCGLPCIDCARGIINSGISTIYCVAGEKISHGLQGDHWEENISRSQKMLFECGVQVRYYGYRVVIVYSKNYSVLEELHVDYDLSKDEITEMVNKELGKGNWYSFDIWD